MLDLNKMVTNCVYVKCKHCGVEKKRIPVGMFPDGRDVKHTDETGRTWNGHKCGKCDNEIKKADQKQRRLDKKLASQKRRERYERSKQRAANRRESSNTTT